MREHNEQICSSLRAWSLLAGRLAGGAFLSPRWERNQRIARGTFRMVPRGPSSRPRGAVCPPLDPPAYVTWSRCSAQNSRPSSLVSRPCSWRSVRFSRKRRSNRALASFPGSFANRENEACEICDDEAEPLSSSGRDSKGDRISHNPGEAYASSGRGGATERLQAGAALT